jgi:LacI family transcriptional regulator
VSKPTIDDVAALAGVARTTVSRVLNDQPNVSDKLRDKVKRAVDTLGYRVNLQARHLAGRKALRLCLIHASDFDSEPNSYFSSALELGATRAGARLGAQLLTHVVNQNDRGAPFEILTRIRDDQCDPDTALCRRCRTAACACCYGLQSRLHRRWAPDRRTCRNRGN